MIIAGIIIFILIVAALGITTLVFISPILMGLIIIIIGNVTAKTGRGKMVLILWNIAAVALTIFATDMLWKDIMSEAVDIGLWPFGILALFGFVSLVAHAVFETIQKQREKKRNQISSDIEDALVPEAFASAIKEEYRDIFNEDPPKGYVKAVYDEYQDDDEDFGDNFNQEAIDEADDEDAVYTYCEVAFDDSGRTYYYRTNNPELQVDDAVYVPFGHGAPKKIGVIVSIEDFAGCDVPFPLERTKFIVGKV